VNVGFHSWVQSIVLALGLRDLLKEFFPCLSQAVLLGTAVPRVLDNEVIRTRFWMRLVI